jgi:hypothetical protein
MSRSGHRTGANRAAYEIRNEGGPGDLTFTVSSFGEAKKLRSASLRRAIRPGTAKVEQYYKIAGHKKEQVVFTVTDGTGRELFRSGNDLAFIRPTYRVYDLPDPLFGELLKGGRKKNPRWNGDMVWGMPLGGFPGALQDAHPYSYRDIRQALSDAGMHFLFVECPHVPSVDKDYADWSQQRHKQALRRNAEESRENGWAGPVLYAPWFVIGRDAAGNRGANTFNIGWLADPVNRKAYVDATLAVMEQQGKDLWAVHAGDEQWGRQHHAAMTFYMKHYDPEKPEHARFRAFAEEIKRDYGFGRFGMHWRMKADHPDYPYCRRAFYTWLSDKLREANRDLRDAVKGKSPDMPLIAEDSHGGSVLDMEYWSEYADMGPFQAQYHYADPSTQSYAFVTKLAKDLSDLDYIMVCPHDCVAGFPTGDLDAEELRELYSQIFRVGGTGFNFWPASYGEKKPSPPMAASLQAGYPLAWQYMIAVAKLARRMPLLEFPKPDAAVFVSSETIKCGVRIRHRNMAAFTFLGPQARGWFRFISEGLLDLQRVKLSDFPIIYLPGIQYTRREVAEDLVKYCEAGGTIVCFDPRALENDITSASMTDLREKLFGVRVAEERKKTEKLLFREPRLGDIRELPVFAEKEKAYDVRTVSSTAKMLATFEDGRPALVENRLGRGRAFYFAWCPMVSEAWQDEGWRKFMTGFHASLGGKLGHDVWRLKIPALVEEDDTDPEGVCLTGNYGYWDRHQFIEGYRFNRNTQGEYSLRLNGEALKVSFREGRLTNRLRLKEIDVPGSVHTLVWHRNFNRSRWVEEIVGGAAVEITFDFKRPYPLGRLRIYYSGEFPGAEMGVSDDGETWRALRGSAQAAKTGAKEVALQDVDIRSNRPARFLRLTLPARSSQESTFMIPEVEVWAESDEGK